MIPVNRAEAVQNKDRALSLTAVENSDGVFGVEMLFDNGHVYKLHDKKHLVPQVYNTLESVRNLAREMNLARWNVRMHGETS